MNWLFVKEKNHQKSVLNDVIIFPPFFNLWSIFHILRLSSKMTPKRESSTVPTTQQTVPDEQMEEENEAVYFTFCFRF
jgi:hypothetical protein